MFNGAYGQQFQGQQQQQQYDSSTGSLAPQQTGYQLPQQGQYGLTPLQTSYQQTYQPQQPQQPQFQNYQAQLNQSFQSQQPLHSQPTGYLQPQQTRFVGQSYAQSQQTGFVPQQQILTAQPTGFTSAAQKAPKNEELKIPNIRLSFLTAQDQLKYEQLFRSAVEKSSNALSADTARDILMRSGLQSVQLGRIWELSDLNKSGQLLFPEFALSLHLVNIALSGRPIPQVLEASTKREVEGFVDAINFSVPDDENNKSKPSFDSIPAQSSLSQLSGLQFGQPASQPLQAQVTGFQPLQPHRTGFQPLQPLSTGFGLQPQSTGYQPIPPPVTFGFQAQLTGLGQPLQPQTTGFGQSLQPQSTGYIAPLLPQATGVQQSQLLQAQKTGVGNNSLFQANLLQPQKTGFQNMNQYHNYNHGQEFIKPEEKQLFGKIFDTYDIKKTGLLDGKTSAEIFRKSGLNRSELEKIWNLITVNNPTHLNKESFSLGMWLIYKKLNGHELPNRLPDSLLPDSRKILNDVKKKLNAQPSSFGKGVLFKKEDKPSSLDLLKSKIEQNKIQLDSLNVQISNNTTFKPVFNGEENLRAIEVLKNQIKSLPTFSGLDDKLKLRDKLSSLTSRVPELIREISKIDNEITNLRIELYKINNPSTIIGTGPNGEATEADKRKAKNKALLNQRMAALTGKSVSDPTVDFDEQQRRFELEVASYKAKSKENQEIIYDIEKTINDLSQGTQETLNKGSNNASYRKFELGLDVQPETAQFIKELRQSRAPSLTTSIGVSTSQAVVPPVPTSSLTAAPQVKLAAKPSTPDPYSSYKTPEDRAAFIKEQAKRKMNERLAKFGLSRNRSGQSLPATSSAAIISPTPAQSASASPIPVAPEPTQHQHHVQPVETPAKKSQPPPVIKASSLPPPSKIRTAQKPAAKDSDDEDEEEKKLRQQLKHLKLKRKAEKDARKAELQRQLAEAEHGDEHEEPIVERRSQPQIFAPQPPKSIATPPVPVPVPVSVSTTLQPTQHHDSNPFAKSSSGASREVSSNNPFGKVPAAQAIAAPLPSTPVDESKIEAQRKAQRGEDDDDGWGSDDNSKESDDDEELPNRQGAAHLAGLLFSGMGPTRTTPSSEVSTSKQEALSLPPSMPEASASQVSGKVVDTCPPPQQEHPIVPPLPQVQDLQTYDDNYDNLYYTSAAPAPAPPLQQTSVPLAQTGFYQSSDPSGSKPFTTTAAASPALEEVDVSPPLIPQAEAPPIPTFNASPPSYLPEVPPPSPPPLPPPLPLALSQSTPSVSTPVSAPISAPAPVPAPPPVPAPAPVPAPPPVPAPIPAPAPAPVPVPPPVPAPPAPPAPPALPALPVLPAPPAPPPLALSQSTPSVSAPVSAPAPAPTVMPVAGGLPFLAEINKRRDDSNVIG